jgi:MFS family permease
VRRAAIDVSPLRESPPFRRLWAGQSISFVGSEIAFVAVAIQLYDLTHSTLDVGLLSLCALVPLLVVPIVGGAIADAVDRRRLLLRTETGLAAVSLLLAGNALLPHPQVWALFAAEAVATTIFSFGTPSMRSLLPRLVAEEQIAAANALEGVYGNLGAVAGPALSGVLVAAIGFPLTFLLDVATFGVSLWSVWRLPALPPAEDADRASLRSIVEGFRYVRTKQALLGIFVVDTNAMVFGMPMALFPAYGAHFGGGARTVGFLYAAPYAGALVASLLSGWVGHVRRQGLGVCLAAAAWGLALVVFGYVDALWPALALLAIAGAADYVSAVLRSTILLTATPDALRGRVSGIEFAQVASAPSLGNLEAGVVASLTSLRFSVVSGGLACIAGTVLCALALPRFIRYDSRRPDA